MNRSMTYTLIMTSPESNGRWSVLFEWSHVRIDSLHNCRATWSNLRKLPKLTFDLLCCIHFLTILFHHSSSLDSVEFTSVKLS